MADNSGHCSIAMTWCCPPPDRRRSGSVAEEHQSQTAATKPLLQNHKPPPPPWENAQTWLNRFVCIVAGVERMGNGLGTLAFTWATVVVLGGFSTDLGKDFWYATAIVFLEAFRVFNRESRSDDQMMFKTTGGIKLKRVILDKEILYYLNATIVMVCSAKAVIFVLDHFFDFGGDTYLMLAAILALVSRFELPTYIQALTLSQRQGDNKQKFDISMILSRLSPMVALLLLVGYSSFIIGVRPSRELFAEGSLFASWCAYNILDIFSPKFKHAQLKGWVEGSSKIFFPLLVATSLIVAFGLLVFFILVATAVLGNIQIPVSVARIVLSWMRLFGEDSYRNNISSNVNLLPALRIFYIMVLGQGLLYIAACMLETILSFSFRRWLAHRCKLADKEGIQSISMYYEYAFEKCMEDGVLA